MIFYEGIEQVTTRYAQKGDTGNIVELRNLFSLEIMLSTNLNK